MDYSFILVIAIIMLSTKVLGLASEKVNMPQVVGALIAGLLLGPSCFGLIGESDFLVKTAEIGVIILMFTAGLDTDVQELKHTGLSAFIIATIGVIVPFLGGAGCYLLFNGEPDSLRMLKAAYRRYPDRNLRFDNRRDAARDGKAQKPRRHRDNGSCRH